MIKALRDWFFKIDRKLDERAERGTTPQAHRQRDQQRYELIERKLKKLKETDA